MVVREINDAGLGIIEDYERPPSSSIDDEGNVHPYLDPVEIWTIGWGHAITAQGRFVKGIGNRKAAMALYPNGLTQVQAQALLRADTENAATAVQRLVNVELGDNEFSALVSFTFNVGAGNLASSTLLKVLNADDRFAAVNEFGRWVLAQGQPMKGLIDRRSRERDLFMQADA